MAESLSGTYEYGGVVMVGLGIYMIILLGIGWWAPRQVTAEADFLVAGRRLGLILSTGALVATWYGAGTRESTPMLSRRELDTGDARPGSLNLH
jgi:hypothetical protein